MLDLLRTTKNTIFFLLLIISTTTSNKNINVTISANLNLGSIISSLDSFSQSSDLQANLSNECVKKFSPIISSLSPACQTKVIEAFKRNTESGRCCVSSNFVATVKDCMVSNLSSFSQSISNISRSNKASFSCFKNNEIFKVLNDLPISQEERRNDDIFIKDLLQSYNNLSHLMAKCLTGLNAVSLEMLSRMCFPSTSLNKFFTTDFSNNFNGFIKLKSDDVNTYKACSEYVKSHSTVSDTLLNSYVDQVNYLLGVDQCNYYSDFFNFDLNLDSNDTFFPSEVVPSKSPENTDSLINTWSTCTASKSELPSFALGTLKSNINISLRDFPNGLSTYIGRSDINFDLIRNTFYLSKFNSFYVKCVGTSCTAYCSTCTGFSWDSTKVITSNNVENFDVSCCNNVCVVYVKIISSAVSGAEVFQINGDSQTRQVDKLLKEKLKNAEYCFNYKKNSTRRASNNTLNQTNSTSTWNSTRNSSQNMNNSNANFTDSRLRELISDVNSNSNNYYLDFRLGTVLSLLVQPYQNSTLVSLMNFLTNDLYARNNSFFLSCEGGKCFYQCRNCDNTNITYQLYKNVSTTTFASSSNLRLARSKSSSSSRSSSSSKSGGSSLSGSSSKSSSSSSSSGSSSSSSRSGGSSLTGSSTKSSGSSLSGSSSTKSTGSSLNSGSSMSSGSSLTGSSNKPSGSSFNSASGSSKTGGSSLTGGGSFNGNGNGSSRNGGSAITNTNLGKSTSFNSYNGQTSISSSNRISSSSQASKLSYAQPAPSAVSTKYSGYTSSSFYPSSQSYGVTSTKTKIKISSNSVSVKTYTKNYNSNFQSSYSNSFTSRNQITIKTKVYYNNYYYTPRTSYYVRFNYYRPTYYSYYYPGMYYQPSWGFYGYYYLPGYNFHYYRARSPYYYNNNNNNNNNQNQGNNAGNLTPDYNPMDWLPSFAQPFDLTNYMNVVNEKLNSLKLSVECCQLFCVTVIDSFEDGYQNTGSNKKRIFLDINLRNYMFIDSRELSPSAKKCMLNNLYTKNNNSTNSNNANAQQKSLDLATTCNLNAPFRTFPLKNSCRNELSQYCGLNKFDELIERFYPENYSASCNQNLICQNVTESSSGDEKAACGSNLAANFMFNGFRVSYSSVAYPCHSTASNGGSNRLTSLVQTHLMKAGTRNSTITTNSSTKYVNEATLTAAEKNEVSSASNSVAANGQIAVNIDNNTNAAVNLNVDNDLNKINADVPASNDSNPNNTYYYSSSSYFAKISLFTFAVFALFLF